ncbi:MAG: hypothetical protein HYZ15_03940 [Sphingobacteriales bacterium]|nr:hypothetical protein [Sphingobacteriales bacterium]
MTEVENDLKLINEKVSHLFNRASLIKFSYSGIYTLEFDLPEEVYGYNYFFLDIGTQLSIFENEKGQPFLKNFSMEDFFLVWSKNVTKVVVENDLSLLICFDSNYCCKVVSKLSDPENIFDMRWSIYQKQDAPSFYLVVSDEENIYLQTP